MNDSRKHPISDVSVDLEHVAPETGEQDDEVIGRAFRWSAAVILGLLIVAGGIAWWQMQESPPDLNQESIIDFPKVRKRPTVEIPSVKFSDVTREAGIHYVHESGASGEKLLPETMGGGCAFFDFDNDGDQDILFVNSRHWPWDSRSEKQAAGLALYQNDGSGQFQDVTAVSGLDDVFYGMGVAAGDFDNDGRVDLFITTVGPNRLYRNLGGKFADVTEAARISGNETEWSTSCGWFDYDNDSDLDLFVCNYVRWSKEFDLSQNFNLVGGGRAYGQPQKFAGTFPYLYRNDGEGKFTDVSADAGLQIKNQSGLPVAKSLGLTFADFDNDGWIDVVVANDTVQNFLFRNKGDGTFAEIGHRSGTAFDENGNATGAMGVAAARFRNDQTIGIAIGNFTNEPTALYVSQDGQLFTDESVSNGLGPATRLELTFGLFFFDCDLDGRLDLFAANGHLEEEINKVMSSQHYEQPPQLFWNCGPQHATEFVPVPAEKCGEDLTRRMVGRGAAFADIDDDGDLDILITATGRTPRLLRNDQRSGHHWLRVKLIGSRSNRDAIGTWIEVHLDDKVLQQQVMPTCSYLSQSELLVTFGLGSEEKVNLVRIRWPDGSTQELVESEVKVDRILRIEQHTDGHGTLE